MSVQSSPENTNLHKDFMDQLELVREEIKGLNGDYEMIQDRLRVVDRKLKRNEDIDKELALLEAEAEQSKTQLDALKQKVETTLSLTEELEEKGILDDDANEKLLQIKVKEKLELIASIKADIQKKEDELTSLQKDADSN